MPGKIKIIGGGSADADYLLPAAKKALVCADMVITSRRFASLSPEDKKTVIFDKISEINAIIRKNRDRDIAVIVSGDPLIFSASKLILREFPEAEIIPGIGSAQLLGAAFGISLDDLLYCSIHGRDTEESNIAAKCLGNKKVLFYCSRENSPEKIRELLCRNGMGKAELFVGEDLGTREERLYRERAENLKLPAKMELALCLVINSQAERSVPNIKDEDFIRNGTPMTKSEVRAVILSKLALESSDIFWDIGAGTGSVSVEAALRCRMVYSVEYKDSALAVLEQNRKKFALSNMKIVGARASAALGSLPLPDKVFIGGSEEELNLILEHLSSLEKKIRVVISAVTLETRAACTRLLKKYREAEYISVTIGRAVKLGRYNTEKSDTTVYIFSAIV
jgi:precorrin-6Y C5,15-methyltransferase (decarboxylating)